jgi:hypothetical protein
MSWLPAPVAYSNHAHEWFAGGPRDPAAFWDSQGVVSPYPTTTAIYTTDYYSLAPASTSTPHYFNSYNEGQWSAVDHWEHFEGRGQVASSSGPWKPAAPPNQCASFSAPLVSSPTYSEDSLKLLTREGSIGSETTLIGGSANPKAPNALSIPPIRYLLAELGLLESAPSSAGATDLQTRSQGPTVAHHGLQMAASAEVTFRAQVSPAAEADMHIKDISEASDCEDLEGYSAPKRRRAHGSASSAGKSRRSRSFGCPICGAMFLSKQHLSRHAHAHDTVKPHACPGCERRFARSDNMKIHYRRSHEAASS